MIEGTAIGVADANGNPTGVYTLGKYSMVHTGSTLEIIWAGGDAGDKTIIEGYYDNHKEIGTACNDNFLEYISPCSKLLVA